MAAAGWDRRTRSEPPRARGFPGLHGLFTDWEIPGVGWGVGWRSWLGYLVGGQAFGLCRGCDRLTGGRGGWWFTGSYP